MVQHPAGAKHESLQHYLPFYSDHRITLPIGKQQEFLPTEFRHTNTDPVQPARLPVQFLLLHLKKRQWTDNRVTLPATTAPPSRITSQKLEYLWISSCSSCIWAGYFFRSHNHWSFQWLSFTRPVLGEYWHGGKAGNELRPNMDSHKLAWDILIVTAVFHIASTN